MKRLSVASASLAALILTGGCSPGEDRSAPLTERAPPVTAQTQTSLTPQGWGPLRIGMTKNAVVAALGPDANPGSVGGADPEACEEFRPERAPDGLIVMIERGRLTRLSVIQGSAITTDKGLGVGAPAADVVAAYGDAALVTPHKYVQPPARYITVWDVGVGLDYVQDPEARGLVYEIGPDDTVHAIRAGGPSIQYVEGCS